MLKPYKLLENVLIEIEEGIKEEINGKILAEKFSMSEVHLRRLFHFAFKQPLAKYIRSRKLSASIDDLLSSNFNVLDIALEYCFEYESSYIKAFKREFGITPRKFSKSGKILKIKSPLHLFDENRIDDNLFFGPEFVMVPEFHLIGKKYRVTFSDSPYLKPQLARQFLENDCKLIKNIINPNVYLGLVFTHNYGKEWVDDFIPSVQVKNFNDIPAGYVCETFKTSLCAKYRYIGHHHFYEINDSAIYKKLWDTILNNGYNQYGHSKDKKYTRSGELRFEKIDLRLCNETYCQMELFFPVIEKSKNNQK
jgi:AraC family transcriptional regulator